MVTANKKRTQYRQMVVLLYLNAIIKRLPLIFHALKAKSDPEVVLKEIHILILLI